MLLTSSLGGDGADDKGFLPRRRIRSEILASATRASAACPQLSPRIVAVSPREARSRQRVMIGDRMTVCAADSGAHGTDVTQSPLTEPNAADMKIAIATNDYTHVSGHAGQARHWLLYDSDAQSLEPQRIQLDKPQIFHHWEEQGPHPLDDVAVIVAGSAGDGFRRRMSKRGVEVLLTSERDAEQALSAVLKGEILPEPGFDPSLLLCRLFDLFSKH